MVSHRTLSHNNSEWEMNPSTRVSVHAWTKFEPVDVTLATAGTAENLFVMDTTIPTVNIATNPSFETGAPPTGYTAIDSTLTRSSTVARTSTYSASINPDNSDAGEGIYWTTPQMAGPAGNNNQMWINVSAYLQDNTDSGDDARIEIRDSTGATTHASSDTITLSSSWQRASTQFLLPQTAVTYRIYIVTVSQHNTTFFADDLQVEIRKDSNTTTYVDGSTGTNDEWMGTAHASESRRRQGLEVIKGWSLHFTRDTYVAFNTTATSTTGTLVRAGSDWTPPWPVEMRSGIYADPTGSKQFISILNVNTGETPRVHGVIYGTHAT